MWPTTASFIWKRQSFKIQVDGLKLACTDPHSSLVRRLLYTASSCHREQMHFEVSTLPQDLPRAETGGELSSQFIVAASLSKPDKGGGLFIGTALLRDLCHWPPGLPWTDTSNLRGCMSKRGKIYPLSERWRRDLTTLVHSRTTCSPCTMVQWHVGTTQ